MEESIQGDPSMIEMAADETTIDSSEISSSNVSSPANRSTEIKKKTAGTNRRASTRVRAKPDYFDASPILPSAKKSVVTSGKPSPLLISPAISNTTNDSDNNVTLTGESQEVDSDEGTLAAFKKPLPIAKKRQAKRTSLDVTVKKAKTSKKSNISQNVTLFDIVKDGKSAMMSVINDWIESYQNDKTTAMTQLVQFFVHSSGCNAEVTKKMLEAEDTVAGIRHLTENFGEQAEEYPLIISRPEFKKFKSNFVSFILQLINLSQHNIIYDDEMMDIVICWITGLSDSQVRAFRHTSTLAGMKIVTALIDVALKVGVEMDHTQRQLDLESQKTANKKSREKIEKLKRRREELNQNKLELEDMMKRIFSAIFVHRYRDVRPEIRKICIAEMGQWMLKYSSYFLDQNYLRYFGWTLYDKVGEVRLEVLNALEELYKNEDFLEKLELFTGRFQSRMIHMTLDTDVDVAVKAIKLATLLYKYDVLQEDDCSQVEQLVFCDQRRMAHAAGEFLALRIIRLSLAASPKKLKKGSKETYLQQMNIKAIIEFFIKTEIHEHCTYLVDSLWEHTDLLKDWKTLTNLLLHKDSLIEFGDEEESALIDLMCCACRQAATGNSPPGRIANKKQSHKEKKTLQDDRTELSTHFMEYLPELVEKYKADVNTMKELLTLPQYFELDLYAEKRLTKQLELLLGHMEDIVMMTADENLLEVCSETYHYLKDNELVIQQTVENSCNKLLDGIFEKFKKNISNEIPLDGKDKEDEGHFNIVTGLKRILAFSKNHNVSDWDVYTEINTIIEQGVNGNVDDEILKLSLHVMFHMFLQHLCSLNSEDPDKAEIKKLRKRQKCFVKQLEELLQFGDAELKTEVFQIFCDLFMFFPKQLLNSDQKFGNIVIQPDAGLQVRMRDYVINHVFGEINEDDEQIDDENEEDDKKAQQLHDKRVLLTGLCRLISNEIFDIKLAAPIYAQFLRAYADYSDIIKYLMHKARENDTIKFAKVLLFSLQQVFESLREDGGGLIDAKSKDFVALKDLARRFALLLGVDSTQEKVRKSIIIIHREGINYAFSYPIEGKEDQVVPDIPPNLLFLEVLHEFIFKMTKVDRKVVIKHFYEIAGNLSNKTGQLWAPMKTYKTNIEAGSDTIIDETNDLEEQTKNPKEKSGAAGKNRNQRTPANKNIKKKLSLTQASGSNKWLTKKTIDNNDDDDDDENNEDEGEDDETSKVAKAIPKLGKPSTDESDVDFNKNDSLPEKNVSKRGSTSNQAVHLSSASKNQSIDGIEESLEDSDVNSSIPEDQQTERMVKSRKSTNKRKTVEDSSQESSSSSRGTRASKRRKRDSDSDISDE